MDNETVQILLTIQKDVSETKGMMLNLIGPEGRVTKLENADTRQWWLTMAITPVLVLLHSTARKFGVTI